MLDFTLVRQRTISMNDFAHALTINDLRQYTTESVNRMLRLLDACANADIIFVPDDPDANDSAAADAADRGLAWTFGHNIVHTTASAEEYAAIATELARGVPFHGRPRYETPWQQITNVEQCRQRLLESRRIRLASLDMWPDTPNLEIGYVAWDTSGWVNAKGIFVWGLAHDDDHYHQMEQIVRQAHAARSG
ncbi:MAG: DinB family protein [Blastochloris sp.]|nr:DinB family protein [Blastochloris sp.]